MSYEDATRWIEEAMDEKFDDFRDLDRLHKGLDTAKGYNNKFAGDHRHDWMDEFIDKKGAETTPDVEARKLDDIRAMEYKEAKAELDSMVDYGEYSDSTVAEARELVEGKVEDVREKLDEAFESGDIRQMKDIDTRNQEQEEIKQNQLNNLVLSMARGYKKNKDIDSLEGLLGSISGLRDEAELREEIEGMILRLKK